MLEYLTQAIVLDYRSEKENDRTVDLYTREFGRLKAKVVGGRRILSKLAPHLDLFNLVTVRLIEKNRTIVTDVLTDERFEKSRRNSEFYPAVFRLFSLVRSLAPIAAPDLRLWYYLLGSLWESKGSMVALLLIFGYDPEHASCDVCDKRPVAAFRAKDQSFFCRNCISKVRMDDLSYL